MRFSHYYKMTTMWLHVLLLSITIPKWTTGFDIIRGPCRYTIHQERRLSKINPDVPCRESSDGITLDLSDRDLRSIDFSVFDNATRVRNLDLSNNHILLRSFSDFSKLKNLEILSLANNNLIDFPRGTLDSKKLKRIDLSNNEIDSLYKFILPDTTDVIMKGNVLEKIKFLDAHEECVPNDRFFYESYNEMPDPWNQTYPFDIIDKSYLQSHLNGNPQLNKHQTSFPKRSYMKLCKTSDGLVKSVSLARIEEPLDNCHIMNIDRKSSRLSLNSLRLKNFQHGWYKIPNNYFTGLSFVSNNISEITPELLNDLPESIIYVDLSDNPIRRIKKNVIHNNFVKTLLLQNLQLTTIEDGAFEKTNLTAVDLTENFLRNLNFARTLPMSIKELKAVSNRISVINEGSLTNLKTLEHLWLSENSLTYLRAGTFRELNGLRYIDLAGNALEAIQPYTFNLENLTVLDLGSNKIKELSPEVFENLQMVEKIDLSNNKIKKISSDTFSGVRYLTMQSIDLSYNQIDTIEEESFSYMTIKSLDLSHNKLTEQSIGVNTFSFCTVSDLNLAFNFMEAIKPYGFSGIKVLNSISFECNNIKILKKGTFENMRVMNKIDLRDNKIQRIDNGALYTYGCPKEDIQIDGEIELIRGCAFCQPSMV